MPENPDLTAALEAQISSLGAADRSVLVATVDTPDSQIATVRGSANDRFWSALQEWGLACETPLDIELPEQLRNFQPRSFALTAPGRELLARLLRGC
jgi:hypothetical protein